MSLIILFNLTISAHSAHLNYDNIILMDVNHEDMLYQNLIRWLY